MQTSSKWRASTKDISLLFFFLNIQQHSSVGTSFITFDSLAGYRTLVAIDLPYSVHRRLPYPTVTQPPIMRIVLAVVLAIAVCRVTDAQVIAHDGEAVDSGDTTSVKMAPNEYDVYGDYGKIKQDDEIAKEETKPETQVDEETTTSSQDVNVVEGQKQDKDKPLEDGNEENQPEKLCIKYRIEAKQTKFLQEVVTTKPTEYNCFLNQLMLPRATEESEIYYEDDFILVCHLWYDSNW